MKEQGDGDGRSLSLPRINFRPFLFSALGISFGIFLYCRIRFGGLVPSDFLFLACFLPLVPYPFEKRKIIALICLFTVFAAAGTVGIHIYTENFLSGKEAGSYTVEGTVTRIAIRSGYSEAELSQVTLDGDAVGGKMSVTLPFEEIRTGDRILFLAAVKRNPLPVGDGDNYAFVNDIRYDSAPEAYAETERGFHPLLFLNAALFDTVTEHMEKEEGLIAYALLTGNSRMVDSGFMTAVRSGGIAHIFAVSGLHIGILYGAVLLLCRPLKRYAAFPAIGLCTLYCALCGFSVSSLRALIMCILLSLNGLFGRKSDLLSSVSLAGTAVLLFLPAQWLSAGFRLSFGACIGLALFSGMLARGMKRIHIPRFLSDYLSASLSVQLFTFPILLEAFGYFSVWGIGLNLVVVPLLPFAFLTLLPCALLSLTIPPAAGFFLLFPNALFAVLLFLFAAVDFGYVLTGFAVGSAGVVWLCSCLYATERVRLRTFVRCIAVCVGAVLFSLCLVAENSLFGGAVIDVYENEDGILALVREEDSSVLILDGELSLREIEDFLRRHTPEIDAAVVLAGEQTRALNIAAFTGAERVYCMREKADGLQTTDVRYGKEFTEGEMKFYFESDEVLTLLVKGQAVRFCFGEEVYAECDLCVRTGCGILKYFLNYGIILLL